MSVTPTAGIAATWSAAKPPANEQAVRLAPNQQAKAGERAEPRKSPPAPEGQGTRVDVRV